MKTSAFTREIWLWLLNEGGYWTASEIARRTDNKVEDVFNCLSGMERRDLIKKRKGEKTHRLVYGVDGTCLVPCGLSLGEVQAP
ncbi:hypothetical protein [uncultured Rhodoferax sp.]|uniref:hypothetical protein n=1 Tax=uncultured Rhodoferax sp. TaxID=223188 RepID=UPI0025F27980|nr:hypothetical protein [uncultured Rhodoferax sp.]